MKLKDNPHIDFIVVVAAELALPVDVRRKIFKGGEASFAATNRFYSNNSIPVAKSGRLILM